MEPFNFNELPEVVRLLFEKVEHIELMLNNLQPKEADENEFLTVKEAAEFLKVTTASLYSKVSRKEIPVSKPGKKLYFRKSELKEWIAQAKRRTIADIQKEVHDRLNKNRRRSANL